MIYIKADIKHRRFRSIRFGGWTLEVFLLLYYLSHETKKKIQVGPFYHMPFSQNTLIVESGVRNI